MNSSIMSGLILGFEKGKKRDKLIVQLTNPDNEISKEIILKNAIIENIEFLKSEHLLSYLKTINQRGKSIKIEENKTFCFNYETDYGQTILLKVYYEKMEEKELTLI